MTTGRRSSGRRRGRYFLRDALAVRLLRYCQFVCGLQVEPEERAVAEIAGEPQRGFRRNPALAVQNIDDPPGRRAQGERERVGGDGDSQVRASEFFPDGRLS
jgi:hypothetical protein